MMSQKNAVTKKINVLAIILSMTVVTFLTIPTYVLARSTTTLQVSTLVDYQTLIQKAFNYLAERNSKFDVQNKNNINIDGANDIFFTSRWQHMLDPNNTFTPDQKRIAVVAGIRSLMGLGHGLVVDELIRFSKGEGIYSASDETIRDYANTEEEAKDLMYLRDFVRSQNSKPIKVDAVALKSDFKLCALNVAYTLHYRQCGINRTLVRVQLFSDLLGFLKSRPGLQDIADTLVSRGQIDVVIASDNGSIKIEEILLPNIDNTATYHLRIVNLGLTGSGLL